MSDTKTTPTPWWIRRNPNNSDEGILVAKPTEDHPYFGTTTTIDIIGDEDYPRKMADMALIVSSVNAHQKMKSALHAFCLAMSVPKSSIRSEINSIRQAYDLARDAIKAAESEDGLGGQ